MERLPEWHDLYVMLGGAAAALIGLLFVSVSLHATTLSSERLWHVRSLAVHALISYLLLLVLAVLLLIPHQSGLRLGLGIMTLGLIGLGWVARFASRIIRGGALVGVRRNDWLRTFAISVASALGLVVIGIGLGSGATALLDYLPVIAVALLLTAVITSWDLLVKIPIGRRTEDSSQGGSKK